VTGRLLPACGIASAVVYLVGDIAGGLVWDTYSHKSQAISELMAIDSPSRPVVLPLIQASVALAIVFGVGLGASPGRSRALRVAAVALVASGVLGFFAQVIFPMHMRGAEPTMSDTMHASLTIVYVFVVLTMIGFAAAAFGLRFRLYSVATVLVLAVFGMLAGQDMAALAAGQPTPWLGFNERVNAYGYQLWIAVLAIAQRREVSARQPALAK
jgi:hypothetical protein